MVWALAQAAYALKPVCAVSHSRPSDSTNGARSWFSDSVLMKPPYDASSASGTPAGNVPNPQVLAISTTAVSPRTAMAAVWVDPDAA